MTFLGKMSNYIKNKYIILFLGDNNMKDKKFIIVKCPKCGYEYLPAEIFTRAFLGKPDNIVRDDDGKIISFEGTTMDLSEVYNCDKCGCDFDIIAKPNFTTSENKELLFDEYYSVPNLCNTLVMSED